jgi:hypothetical protein
MSRTRERYLNKSGKVPITNTLQITQMDWKRYFKVVISK